MRHRLARLGLASALLVAAVARGSASVPVGALETVEVVRDGRSQWVPTTERTLDEALATAGESALGVRVPVKLGDRVVRRGDGWAIEASSLPLVSGAPVDLNRAPLDALLELPGIGSSRAVALVDARPFLTRDDLVRARGIGPSAARRLDGLVSVHDQVPPPSPVAIDVNCAPLSVLVGLPRVGPVLAERIVAARPFASVDDLERVRGIGPATLAGLRPLAVAGACL